MTPSTASSSFPPYFIVCLLIIIVSAPMATSSMLAPKPDAIILLDCPIILSGLMIPRDDRPLRKWERRIEVCIRAPSAVARPAPNIPISSGKTKNQSPNMLKHPPVRTAFSTRDGCSSYLITGARYVLIMNR